MAVKELIPAVLSPPGLGAVKVWKFVDPSVSLPKEVSVERDG